LKRLSIRIERQSPDETAVLMGREAAREIEDENENEEDERSSSAL
jgi:hypothetical protein